MPGDTHIDGDPGDRPPQQPPPPVLLQKGLPGSWRSLREGLIQRALRDPAAAPRRPALLRLLSRALGLSSAAPAPTTSDSPQAFITEMEVSVPRGERGMWAAALPGRAPSQCPAASCPVGRPLHRAGAGAADVRAEPRGAAPPAARGPRAAAAAAGLPGASLQRQPGRPPGPLQPTGQRAAGPAGHPQDCQQGESGAGGVPPAGMGWAVRQGFPAHRGMRGDGESVTGPGPS